MTAQFNPLKSPTNSCAPSSREEQSASEPDALRRDLAAQTKRVEELERVNDDLKAFCQSVAHELGGPLHSVALLTKMLTDKHGSELRPEAARLLSCVSRASTEVEQVLQDLLAFSRVTNQSITRDRIETTHLVHQLVRHLEVEFEAEHIEFCLSPLPVCWASPGLVRQVFINLLRNAIKFSRGRALIRIEVSARMAVNETIFYVRDNGVGFDPRLRERLFQPFARLHDRDLYQGSGLGLSIVKRIVERHHGRVWAESTPGEGATFFFSLPDS
jgi:light-regulated signal transduction histidine kinase (bacteriophytochrome)